MLFVARYDGASACAMHTLSLFLTLSVLEFRSDIVCTPLTLSDTVSPCYCVHPTHSQWQSFALIFYSSSVEEVRHGTVCTLLTLSARATPWHYTHTDAEKYLATNHLISKDLY
jgi:hypothetical protein